MRGPVRRRRFDRQRLLDVQHRVRHVVVVAAEVAHRAVADVPPAVPPRPGEIRLVVRPRRRRTEPQIEVVGCRNRHLFLEPFDDLDAVVEPVRLVELLRRRGVLEAPRAVRPDVHLANRTDHAGHEDFFDRPARRRRVALVAHLRRQIRVLRSRLANEPRFPDVVGERLLAVDVLAVRQRQIGRKRVCVLGGGDHDGVEVVRAVEDFAEVVERLGLWKPLRRGVERESDSHRTARRRSRRDAVRPPRQQPGPRRLRIPGVMMSSLMLSLARPPQAMNAMSSLLFRFRPRSSAGAPATIPAAVRAPPTNSRRVIRRGFLVTLCFIQAPA